MTTIKANMSHHEIALQNVLIFSSLYLLKVIKMVLEKYVNQIVQNMLSFLYFVDLFP